MATQIPASLRTADISRFVHRAAQLENLRPVVAYWCNYWIAQQILSKSLHNADQDALTYTTTIMDKLEQFKDQNKQDPAVTDDVAGKAYIEKFGLETFDRAEKAVHENRVDRKTADAYQASSTFMDLLEIWGPVDPEIARKIKYAKFHALRIVKAIKAGEDPNLSNPVPESVPEEQPPPLDPNDPEVRMIEGNALRSPESTLPIQNTVNQEPPNSKELLPADESLHRSPDVSAFASPKPRQPSVVAVPDEADADQAYRAGMSFKDESLHPSRAQSGTVSPLPLDAAAFYDNHTADTADISPISPNGRKTSDGGNFFPRMPSPTAPLSQTDAPSNLPSAPNMLSSSTPPINLPGVPSDSAAKTGLSLPPPPVDLASSNNQSPDTILHPNVLDQGMSSNIPPNWTPAGQAPQARSEVPSQLRQTLLDPSMAPIPKPQPIVNRPSAPLGNLPSSHSSEITTRQAPVHVNVEVDEAAMAKAEKHARWAISALNFEDVPTAVQNLQLALRMLGVT